MGCCREVQVEWYGGKLRPSVWTRVRAGLKKCGKAFPNEVLEDASFAKIKEKLKSSSSRGIPQGARCDYKVAKQSTSSN